MKRDYRLLFWTVLLLLLFNFTIAAEDEIVYDFDFSTLKEDEIPDFLRQGTSADIELLTTAVEMYLQGWRYFMPRPKSAQARWGNRDGRTTWYYGSWYNEKTKQYSSATPKKQEDGYYVGDDRNLWGAHLWATLIIS